MLYCSVFSIVDVFSENPPDPTQLICVLLQTELAGSYELYQVYTVISYSIGILPLLYALLLHDGPPRHSTLPPALPSHLLSIATAGIKAINNMAILALRVVQVSPRDNACMSMPFLTIDMSGSRGNFTRIPSCC